MPPVNAPENTYTDKLREALDREGWSQGRLVRELAARTGNAVQSERSAVRGYLDGAKPRPERAALIAEIVGVPDLAEVEHRSAAARLEARLEELGTNDAAILASLQELREAVVELRAALRTAPKQSRAAR
jgi:hypothetical protein